MTSVIAISPRSVGEFCERVAGVCLLVDGSVTSWGRSRKRNEDVGGVANSWHLQFLGADVVLDDTANESLLFWAARRLGLQVVKEEDHYHLEPA